MLTCLTSRPNYLIKNPKPQYQNLVSIKMSATSVLAEAFAIRKHYTELQV